MKWSKAHKEHFEDSYSRKGRQNGFLCKITYSAFCGFFCFTIRKEDYFYNSFANGRTYGTEEECIAACTSKVNNYIRITHCCKKKEEKENL